jgi:glycosyltransferase involved in cell wall biosynthesis
MQQEVDRALPGQDVALGLTQWSAPYLLGRTELPHILDEVELTVIADQRRAGGFAGLRQELTWWTQSRFVRRVAADFSRITVVSSHERDLAVSVGCDPERVVVVPNGVAEAWLDAPRPPIEPGRVIYPGSVTFAPNLDAVRFFVTDVLPKVRQAQPRATMFVTGSTDGAAIADLSARPGVVFTNHVADVRSEVARSAVCVVPLRTGGGTRLKILEALALGVPVVSTPKGAEGLELEDGRDLLVADSAETLAAATLRVLGDDQLAARLSAAGRRIVRERYTWEIAGDALNRALEESRR